MDERLSAIYNTINEMGIRVAINTSNCPLVRDHLNNDVTGSVLLTNIDVLKSPDYFDDLVEEIYEDKDETYEVEGSTEFYKSERVTDILFAYYDTALTMSISIEKKDNSNRAIVVTYNAYTGKYSRLIYDFWDAITLEDNVEEIVGFIEVELESELEKIRNFKNNRTLGLRRA